MSRLFGDWDKFQNKLTGMTKMGNFLDSKLQFDSETVLSMMKNHILNQDLPWVSLSDSTVEHKKSSLIYLETKYLVDNLAIQKTSKGYFIGALNGTEHEPSGLEMSKLLKYLEFGTDRIPPRPLVKPTYEEYKSKFYALWVAYLKEYFRSR